MVLDTRQGPDELFPSGVLFCICSPLMWMRTIEGTLRVVVPFGSSSYDREHQNILLF
jgi:hypothetical protein